MGGWHFATPVVAPLRRHFCPRSVSVAPVRPSDRVGPRRGYPQPHPGAESRGALRLRQVSVARMSLKHVHARVRRAMATSRVLPFGRCTQVTARRDSARLCLTLGIAGPTLRRDIPDFASLIGATCWNSMSGAGPSEILS
jgi:hypothetical protein